MQYRVERGILIFLGHLFYHEIFSEEHFPWDSMHEIPKTLVYLQFFLQLLHLGHLLLVFFSQLLQLLLRHLTHVLQVGTLILSVA